MSHIRSLTIAFIIFVNSSAFATSIIYREPPTGPPDPRPSFAPIRYSHMVVECTIESIERKSFSGVVAGLGDEPVRLHVAILSHVSILRGAAAPRRVIVEWDLPIGRRIVLCGYWNERAHLFWIGHDRAFIRQNDGWIGLGRPAGSPEITITDSELQELVRRTRPPSLTDRADVILIGRVDSVVDSIVESDAFPHGMRSVMLTPQQVLKGDPAICTVLFQAQRWSSYEFREGEHWFVFLALNGDGNYEPVDRQNALLLVHGQALIYDRKVVYPYSRLSLTQTVMHEQKN